MFRQPAVLHANVSIRLTEIWVIVPRLRIQNNNAKGEAVMNDNLLKVTKKWMELERKTLQQRKEAEAFYEKHLMKLIEEDFIERNHKMVYGDAE